MAAPKYVTHAELDSVQQALETLASKKELERLAIRVEVLTNDVHQLTNQVGDVAEDLAEFRSEVSGGFGAVESRFAAVDQRFAELTKIVQDGQAALVAAITQLGRR